MTQWPEDVVERVARAIYKNNPATHNGQPMSWEECAHAFPERLTECTEDAEAAIATANGTVARATALVSIARRRIPMNALFRILEPSG